MRRSRRMFLGGAALVLGAGLFAAFRLRETGPEERLMVDPEARGFVFRDGWLEQV